MELDPEVGVVILTGSGDQAFIAGAEMTGFQTLSPLAAVRRARQGQALTDKIERCAKPVIAAVNGLAFGAGFEVCLACDLVLAVSEARFSLPETRLGFIPHWGATQRLTRLVGPRVARELILTGDVIDAARALELGLVNALHPADALMAEARELAGRILRGGRVAVQQARLCIDMATEAPLERGLAFEANALALCFSTDEPRRGLEDFLKE